MDSLLEHDADILNPPWGPYGRDATLGLVSGLAKLLLRVANTLTVPRDDLARFTALALDREPGVGLLTYCNHTSTFDDPGLPSAMLPWSVFWTEHRHGKMRWTMCARDVCFKSDLLRQFFANGKTLPVERGSGANQPVIGAAARLLAAGDWLHVFPEGRVQPAGDVGAFRQGVGKLVCEARAASGRDPVVLPYFHSGMGRVVPYLSMLPRVGHEVTVVVGQPVDLAHITCRCNQPGEDQQEVWRDIAAVLREALLQLEKRAPPNPNQLEERPELKEIVAARARKRDSAGSGSSNGALEGGRQESLLSWLAVPATDGDQEEADQGQQQVGRRSVPWWGVASVLERPEWTPDQEHRQKLLWAQGLLRWQQRHRHRQTVQELGSHQQEAQPQ